MSAAELFGLIVSVLVFGYLVYALLRGEQPVTAQGWLQIVFYVVVLTALTPVLGAYMARVYQGEHVFLDARARAGRAAHLPRAPHRPRARSRTGRPTRARRSSSAPSSSSCCT